MPRIVPLPLYEIKKNNKIHEVYTIIVNSLINKYNERPTESNYRMINKMHVSYKNFYLDKFILDNTIRGKFYGFLLNLAHILIMYNKSNTIKQILHKIIQKEISIEIFLKYQDEKNIYKEIHKTIKIYPWRTVIEMNNNLYDYNYGSIIDGIMNIFLNILLKSYDIIDIQNIKIITNIPNLEKKLSHLEYKFKESFK